MAEAAISAASKMPHSQKQTDLLDQTKTVAESATELLYAVKDAGGNPKVIKVFRILWYYLISSAGAYRDEFSLILVSCSTVTLSQ